MILVTVAQGAGWNMLVSVTNDCYISVAFEIEVLARGVELGLGLSFSD